MSSEFMNLIDTEVENTPSETSQSEAPPEEVNANEDLVPLDISSNTDSHALHASGLFAMSSVGGGLMGQVMDDLNRVEDLGSLDEMPKRQSQGTPLIYPQEARAKGLEGYVTVNLLVGKDGRILKALLVDSLPPGVFDEPALNAARSWVFTPPRRDNETVQVWLKQTIRFDLED
jgi:protein TonB